MTINLIPGYRAEVEIKDSFGNPLYKAKFYSPGDLDRFVTRYGASKEVPSLLFCSVIPLRVDTLKNFSKDFFLPTFINFTLKINSLALRVIASIFAIIFDFITFPIRLITASFRVFLPGTINHPMIGLLKAQIIKDSSNVFHHANLINPNRQLSQKAIESGVVTLTSVETIVRDLKSQGTDENGDILYTTRQSIDTLTKQVIFKTLPGIKRILPHPQSENATYIKLNDEEWVRENYSTVRG